MDGQQGTYELTSDKLKPLDAGKVVDKDRVSVEVAHPQPPSAAQTAAPVASPAPVPAVSTPTPAPAVTQTAAQPTPQSALQNASVTTGGVSTSSASGDPTSLGDAARQARQKKQAQGQK
jgi:hypothetical protein